MGRACSTKEAKRKARWKETNRKTKTWWVDNIKLDLRETGWGGVDWIGLAEVRDRWRALVNMVMNLRVPKIADKCSCTTGGFSGTAPLHEVS
jgi:hypothetical protein